MIPVHAAQKQTMTNINEKLHTRELHNLQSLE